MPSSPPETMIHDDELLELRLLEKRTARDAAVIFGQVLSGLKLEGKDLFSTVVRYQPRPINPNCLVLPPSEAQLVARVLGEMSVDFSLQQYDGLQRASDDGVNKGNYFDFLSRFGQ